MSKLDDMVPKQTKQDRLIEKLMVVVEAANDLVAEWGESYSILNPHISLKVRNRLEDALAALDKSEFPSQTENRKQLILDTVKNNQHDVATILLYTQAKFEFLLALNGKQDMSDQAKLILDDMHKQDRDALLQPNGIFSDEQLEMLK